MSPDGDLVFAPSDSLLMSDFSNLTEFDDFPKDLFLSNAMEGMADGSLLEELDCKDDLKLIAVVDEAFGASLKASDADMDSMKERDSPFTMFMDEETSESLQLVNLTSQLDSPTDSDGIGIQSMGLMNTIDNTSVSTGQGGLHTAILAARELNCMSLDELDLTPVKSPDEVHTLSSPSLSLSITSAEPTPSLAPLSSLGKAVASSSMFNMEVQPLCSSDMVTPSIQITLMGTSPSSTLAFSKPGGGLKIESGGADGLITHRPKSTVAQSSSVNAREDSTGCDTLRSSQVIQGPSTHAPSIQRSQSSHALGQLRASQCLGPHGDDVSLPPVCKQEVPFSGPSNVNLFSLYQSSNTEGLSGRPAGSPIRRVYSTGDLQGLNRMQSFYGMKVENAIPEEAASVKIGHYTLEERRMKLHRYRQKRMERNFSKKIKYACRKTLADNRPRVRGRFARSDEMGDSSLRGSDLPLIDEYEEVTSHHPRIVREQQAFLMANNSCVMSSNSIAQFWSTVGMKVAM